jgi:hypothetical protein
MGRSFIGASAGLMLLFKAEQETFVLCEAMDFQDRAKQINPCMENNLIFSNDCQSFKQIQVEMLKQKFCLNVDKQENTPGFRSQQIIQKIISLVETGTWEKYVCL